MAILCKQYLFPNIFNILNKTSRYLSDKNEENGFFRHFLPLFVLKSEKIHLFYYFFYFSFSHFQDFL